MNTKRSILCAILVSLPVFPTTFADEATVRKTLSDYVDNFNQRAADKVASFWTENGTYTDRVTGERTTGRDAIQADLTKVLAEPTAMKLSAQIHGIKFITDDVASVEGETTLVLNASEPVISTFNAILVRKEERWLLDSIQEADLPQPSSAADALSGLTWLVGTWVDDGGDTKVHTTFRWTASQAFLLRSFTVETPDGVAMTGTQVIGWDPRALEIRSWSFNSNGSFGESVWSKSAGAWRSKSVQTLADGRVAAGTYVMERQDDNAFTMQLVGHEIEGQPQPASPTVRVVRVKEQSAAASAIQQ